MRRAARANSVSGHALVLIHMVRHVLLGAVLPPLVWLIAPLLLPALGRSRRARVLLTPFLRGLTHPVTTWLAGTLTVIGWHIPPAFELAQSSAMWHSAQ